MKLNLRSALPLLIIMALFYSACKKNENKPASGPGNDEVSAAIAKNLVQSLSGAYGGASIKDGVAPSAAITASSAKLKTQSEIGCGFFIDNSLDLKFNQGDTIKSETVGSVNYFFLCDNQRTTGYNLYDSLSTTGKGPGYEFFFALVQDFKVRGLNVDNSNFTLNGRLKSYVDFNHKTKPKSSSSVHNIFHFIDAQIHAADNYDIVDGSATFESIGETSTGAWDYSGTIKFLGNHKAKLTFLSKVYLIDLLTGSVTPA
ncbi:hypothetical protein [Mucilaginibacter flavidus]|uniref:hypothetical protein n=1 Tax=Mucilaginibacter flavidus TaxID=2949309 RepID=UPI002093EDB6|nr:hypothetical protein [Mucilaginibacter flavidus]MCO5949674.1 hypothetical protein [Mucilaginibacter flavidus]